MKDFFCQWSPIKEDQEGFFARCRTKRNFWQPDNHENIPRLEEFFAYMYF